NDKALPQKVKSKMEAHLFKALLAADQVEEGVAMLRELIAAEAVASAEALKKLAGAAVVPADQARKQWSSAEHIIGKCGDHAVTLAHIGRLLSRKEWIEEGVTKALNSAKQLCRPEFSSPYQRDSSVTKVSDLLFELGRGPEAQELFHEDILAA